MFKLYNTPQNSTELTRPLNQSQSLTDLKDLSKKLKKFVKKRISSLFRGGDGENNSKALRRYYTAPVTHPSPLSSCYDQNSVHCKDNPNENSPASSSQSNPPFKRVVGPHSFKLIQVLGRGDSGTVYLAEKKSNKLTYAMKVLKKEDLVRRKKNRRVLMEKEVLSNTIHPFIANLYFSFQSTQYLFLVMDYYKGGEFYKLLQSRKKSHAPCLTENETRFYCSEILSALEYLHLVGFIYRDLKPENILIQDSGHIVLTDFDLSTRRYEVPSGRRHSFSEIITPDIDQEVNLRLTRSNSFVGTEEYISPEVLEGRAQTCALDWWTLGILLYEMLLGYTPFKGFSRHSTFLNILHNPVSFPKYAKLSKITKNLIRALLIKEETRRLGYQSSKDIKRHSFFEKVDWSNLMNQTPPFIPASKSSFQRFSSYVKRPKEIFSLDLEREKLVKSTDLNPFKHFNSEECII